jgi:cysteinyl-tRNA synthetase
MRFYNTLTRSVVPFEPLSPGRVGLYTCGPTVYNYAHIGNFRAYLFEDILRRVLKHGGYAVTQVMNLTDVDDKTIRGARAAGVPLDAFTRPFKEAFFEDLKTLSIEPAEHYPEATAHIPDMIGLIQILMDKGYAYQSDDGSVYFSIARFPAYGRLVRLDKTALRPGARVSHDEYEKENLADFALWKAWDPDDGDVAWDSPWGRGRPGWHIECSAMSMKYLGPTFDIHTGGIDNAFPHHEDEMAQSEAATGKPFARYWLHCAHLIVDGRKMSKSLGNFYTLRDLTARGYSGREIRYVLLSAHYRQPLNFTFEALQSARSTLVRLDEFRLRLTRHAEGRAGAASDRPAWLESYRSRFFGSLEDDLGMPEALAALFQLVATGNRALDSGEWTPAEAHAVLDLLAEMDTVLAVLAPSAAAEADADVQALVAQREEARRRKDWAEADRIRSLLAEKGWAVQDTPQGPQLRRLI